MTKKPEPRQALQRRRRRRGRYMKQSHRWELALVLALVAAGAVLIPTGTGAFAPARSAVVTAAAVFFAAMLLTNVHRK